MLDCAAARGRADSLPTADEPQVSGEWSQPRPRGQDV